MEETFIVTARINDQLIRVLHMGKEKLWSLGKVRKSASCCLSGKGLEPGDMAFRELTGNSMYRHKRMSIEAVEQALLLKEITLEDCI